MVESPAAVLTVLSGVAALFFFIEKKTEAKLFQYFPPLLFIYAVPVLLRNTGVLPDRSAAYDVLKEFGLPAFITLMLLAVDVRLAVKVMGKGVLVMLMGSLGVVVGGVVAWLAVGSHLAPGTWRAFGALAGSWIGGTGNMMAAGEALGADETSMGLAIVVDSAVYLVWLPLLLSSKAFAERFNRWARVDPKRVERMVSAAEAHRTEPVPPAMRHLLYLATVALGVTWLASGLAPLLPELPPVLSTSTWRVLLVSSCGLALSFTPVRRIPGSHAIAMAIVYVFVARMGAQASLEGIAQAPAFLAGGFIWISVHGAFCLFSAWLLRVDLHSVAIASAANIGGAASAPVVAGYHNESLVPASILMAVIGYGLGNYLAILTGQLCFWIGGG